MKNIKLDFEVTFDAALIFLALRRTYFSSPPDAHSATRLVRLDTYYFAFPVSVSCTTRKTQSCGSPERINRPAGFQRGAAPRFSDQVFFSYFAKKENLNGQDMYRT